MPQQQSLKNAHKDERKSSPSSNPSSSGSSASAGAAASHILLVKRRGRIISGRGGSAAQHCQSSVRAWRSHLIVSVGRAPLQAKGVYRMSTVK